MTEQQPSPIITFYKNGWENYQQALVKTIASLSPEQLALPTSAHSRSIGELLDHMIGARYNWFVLWMGEEPSDPAYWDDGRAADEPPTDAASLIEFFEKTWNVIDSAMTRWTPTDLEQVFAAPESHQAWLRKQGLEEEPPHTRLWITWHVMEHEIHHGGELALGLGAHGIESFYTW